MFKKSILLLFCIISFTYPYAADDLEERAFKKPRLEESSNIRWEKVHQIKRGVDLLPKVLEWKSFLSDQEIADVTAALAYCYLKKRNLPKAWYYEFPIILYKLNDQNHLRALNMIKIINELPQCGDIWYNILKWTHDYDSITYIKRLVKQYNSLYKIPEEDKNISIMKSHIKSVKELKDPKSIVYGIYPPYGLFGRSDNRNVPLDCCKLMGKNNEKDIKIINEKIKEIEDKQKSEIPYPVALIIKDKGENQKILETTPLLDLFNNPTIKHLSIGPLVDDNVFLSSRVLKSLRNNKSLISFKFISSWNYQGILNILYAVSMQKFLQCLDIDFSDTRVEDTSWNTSLTKGIRGFVANSGLKSLILRFTLSNSDVIHALINGIREIHKSSLENFLIICPDIGISRKNKYPLILVLNNDNIMKLPFDEKYKDIRFSAAFYAIIYSKSGNWKEFLSQYVATEEVIARDVEGWKSSKDWKEHNTSLINENWSLSSLRPREEAFHYLGPIQYGNVTKKASSTKLLSVYLDDVGDADCSIFIILPAGYTTQMVEQSLRGWYKFA